MPTNARPVEYSKVTLTELMIPSYANFGGKIHGGILLSLMDKVAYACASKHSGNYCVTVNIDNVDFLNPVEVGDLVSLKASVNYVGKTSLVVGIRVTAENVKTGKVRHTNTSYFTMVAKDEQSQPILVPELILEKKVEIRRFLEALKRRELKKQYAVGFSNLKKHTNPEKELSQLENERCQLALE